jgi:hypothetical protein
MEMSTLPANPQYVTTRDRQAAARVLGPTFSLKNGSRWRRVSGSRWSGEAIVASTASTCGSSSGCPLRETMCSDHLSSKRTTRTPLGVAVSLLTFRPSADTSPEPRAAETCTPIRRNHRRSPFIWLEGTAGRGGSSRPALERDNRRIAPAARGRAAPGSA